MRIIFFLIPFFAISVLTISCKQSGKDDLTLSKIKEKSASDTTQNIFWEELIKLCGKAYQGVVVSSPSNDTAFTNKVLVMHVRLCESEVIKIPFFVGSDSSRTWVFTKDTLGIVLKHDHRHRDGTHDQLTMYGGKTSNFGSAVRQIFPADQQTADMLPGAITNVWWIDLVPGEHFTYNLRRVNTERLFSIRFDLSKEINTPGKPWGWDK